jgi:hypothetical protein
MDKKREIVHRQEGDSTGVGWLIDGCWQESGRLMDASGDGADRKINKKGCAGKADPERERKGAIRRASYRSVRRKR